MSQNEAQPVNTDLCQVVDYETIKVRTYEAGIYYETLACGTGATACAAVAYLTGREEQTCPVIGHNISARVFDENGVKPKDVQAG